MVRSWLVVTLGVIGVVVATPWLVGGARGARQIARSMPEPTEHWLDDGAEARNKADRKAWMAQRHLAPPEVDWREVELANGLRLLARRNEIGSGRLFLDLGPARWQERGSDNQAGRMHVAVHATDGRTLYAGSSKGGVWKGTLDGEDWAPIGDGLYGGAHWLSAVSGDGEGDPDVVVAATDGGLVHFSDDDGATWRVPAGLPSRFQRVRRLVAASDGSDAVYLVARADDVNRLYRSDDGGRSFSQLWSMGAFEGDVWVPRDGGSGLWMAADGSAWFSDDEGRSFNRLGAIGGGTRAELAGSEAGAPRLYAVLDGARLYRSDDAGAGWTRVRDVNDYWGALAASIDDPDVFVWGGVEAHRTADGGARFDVVNKWSEYYGDPFGKLHADMMGFDVAVDADGSEVWYANTDGGLYRSFDRLATVENVSTSGLRVSQYYSTLTSSTDPTRVAAGAQDQGYQITNGVEQDDAVLEFTQVISGDYAHLTSSDGTHGLVYSVYPGFVLVQLGGESPTLSSADFPESERAAWLPPIVADPGEPWAFFFPATRIYRYLYDTGARSWVATPWSDVLAPDDGEYLGALAFSPVDPSRAFAVTSRGKLYVSDDGARSWTRSRSTGPTGQYFHGTALLPSSWDADTAFVGGSGYGGVPAVMRTTDGGQTWHAHAEGLGETLVYALAEAPDGSRRLFAGTENAAWMREPDGFGWVDIVGDRAPITTYWSVEALRHENTVRFGTYGRGIWDFQLDPDHLGCFPVHDHDGDGFECDVDCDDHDPDTFPGAREVCDGVERNCVEGDLVEEDFDGDGFLACEDCDDADASVFPGADEPKRADGTDQDCDGEDGRGCGCATGPGGGWWLAGLLVVFARRRRRTAAR